MYLEHINKDVLQIQLILSFQQERGEPFGDHTTHRREPNSTGKRLEWRHGPRWADIGPAGPDEGQDGPEDLRSSGVIEENCWAAAWGRGFVTTQPELRSTPGCHRIGEWHWIITIFSCGKQLCSWLCLSVPPRSHGPFEIFVFSTLLLNAYLFDSLYIWHKNNTKWQCIPHHFQVKRWKVRVAQVVQSQGHTGFIVSTSWLPAYLTNLLYLLNNEVVGGYILVSLRPSVLPSVPPAVTLCNIFSSGWILSILATNDHYHERECHTQWPLTLTYIFKVIWPWLWKSCPLCSVYSSEWILFIFCTNDHYYQRVCLMVRYFQNMEILIFGKFLKFFGLDLEKKIYSSRWILSIYCTNGH